MQRAFHALSASLLVLCSWSAQAASISLTPTLAGSLSYNSGLFGTGPHYGASDAPSYTWNSMYEMNAGEWVDSASTIYLVYDISGIPFDAQDAWLETRFSNQGISPLMALAISNLGLNFDITQAQHTLSVVDPSIVPGLQTLSGASTTVDVTLLTTVDNTAQVASTQYWDAGGEYEFELNMTGIDAIDSAQDYLVLAFIPTDAFDGGSALRGSIDTGDLPILHVSSVPLPAAAWLFGSAIVALGVLRRPGHRHRNQTA